MGLIQGGEHLSASGLSKANVGVLLDAVAAVAKPVRLAYLWRPTLPDVDDDMVLEAAVNGRADGIVTVQLARLRRGGEAIRHCNYVVSRSSEAVGKETFRQVGLTTFVRRLFASRSKRTTTH